MRTRHPSSLGTLFVGTALVACATEPPVTSQTAEVVYGTDDRTDVYAHPDPQLQTLARRSIVALIRPDALDLTDPSNVQFVSNPLSQEEGLCSTADCGQGEEVTYVHRAITALCAATTSARLCPALCGNALCEPGETSA